MGQRHQLFVIARINGKYRSLAAVHNQWLYGHTALRRCLSTLGIFQDSDNRVPIEAELTMASTKDEAFWTRPEGNERWPIDVKFPFIMTCLILGASFGAEEGYHRAVHAEPFHMAYDEGDNNNGITIFDISEPSSVRYCFVDFLGMESPREVQLMAPLTARIYLEAYYDLEDSDTKYLEGLVEDLAPYYLIDAKTLEDTWPGQGWEDPLYSPHVKEVAGEAKEDQPTKEADLMSLRDRALDQLADAVSKGADMESHSLSDAEMLSDFWPKVKERLYANANSLEYSRPLLDVFFKSLKDDTYIDMGPFVSFSIPEIGEVVHRLSHEGSLVELDLSCRRDLSRDAIHTIVHKDNKTLHCLFIMESTSVTANDIAKCGLHGDVYQHQLFKRPIIGTESYGSTAPPLLEFPTQHNVIQLAWIGVPSNFLLSENSYHENGLLVWDTLEIEVARPQVYGRYHDQVRCTKYPLTDSPLPLVRLVTGLKNILLWTRRAECLGAYDVSKGAATAFALGATGSDLRGGVGPLSTELYLENGFNGVKRGHLMPGEWAILLIHPCCDFKPEGGGDSKIERTWKKAPLNFDYVHYALIGRKEDSDTYDIADVPTFLKGLGDGSATALVDWWQQQADDSDYIHFYDKADIQDILKKVYPSIEEQHGEEQRAEEQSEAKQREQKQHEDEQPQAEQREEEQHEEET